MELKLIKQDPAMLHEGFGISDERNDEIIRELDRLVATIFTEQGGRYDHMGLMEGIAKICDSPEELMYATYINKEWLDLNFNLTK